IIIKYDTHVTTFKWHKRYPKFQLIKRAYSNLEEVLAGFDLNSSRVALVSPSLEEKEEKMEVRIIFESISTPMEEEEKIEIENPIELIPFSDSSTFSSSLSS